MRPLGSLCLPFPFSCLELALGLDRQPGALPLDLDQVDVGVLRLVQRRLGQDDLPVQLLPLRVALAPVPLAPLLGEVQLPVLPDDVVFERDDLRPELVLTGV
jgi:hypothetical protein